MDLEKLKDVIPFKFRIQSYSKDKKKASVVAYIDARDVMDRLDEVVGMGNWKKSFYEVKGNLFCSVSIKINGEWVEMSDCGKESRTDKEKGEASDAFKRACIAWGIGRFLYHIPIQWADTDGIGEYPKLVSNGNTIKDISEFFFLKLKREGKLPQNVSKNIPATNEKLEVESEKKEIVASEKVTNINKKPIKQFNLEKAHDSLLTYKYIDQVRKLKAYVKETYGQEVFNNSEVQALFKTFENLPEMPVDEVVGG